MSDHVTPQIYVACLAAYNAGYLHGRWIDATQGLEGIQAEIQEILESSPIPGAEEWAIHDHEGFGRSVVGEYTGIPEVAAMAEFIEENPEICPLLLEHYSGDLDQAREALENYLGCYESLTDYARELTEECTQIPDNLAFYIDYEAMARDMELNGDVMSLETGFEEVHIFLNC